MALSAFDDKTHPPTAEDLRRTLGKSAVLWDRLIAAAAQAHAPMRQEWNFAGAKYGWSLRLKHRERAVLYLTPQAGAFRLGVAIGEKAAAAAGVSARVRAMLDEAPRYAEGRGVQFSVTSASEVSAALELAALKLGPSGAVRGAGQPGSRRPSAHSRHR